MSKRRAMNDSSSAFLDDIYAEISFQPACASSHRGEFMCDWKSEMAPFLKRTKLENLGRSWSRAGLGPTHDRLSQFIKNGPCRSPVEAKNALFKGIQMFANGWEY